MRTDSVNLSETALSAIASEITTEFGDKYLKTRRYKGKNSNAQEAHEAIRPTYIERQNVSSQRDEQRLYELIWKRTIASQMADAELEKTTVKIGVSTIPDARLNAVGEVMKFDGFLKVYIESKDDDNEDEAKGILPPLKKGQILPLQVMKATERFTRPPARYTEASLVSKLEELGIGRPSTYAPTISKIMEENRGYVIKDSREGEERNYTVLKLSDNKVSKKVETERTGVIKNRLFSTDLGMVVTDFLKDNFDEVMDYSFTADIEEKFDKIADGKQEWEKMLADFYPEFHETVQETLEKSGRATGERILGTDPESGRTILVRMSRFGTALVQIGSREELDEDEKPKYANLNPGQSLETITLEEALDCFKLPRDLGTYEGKELSIGSGRFGPYVKFDEKFISIPRGEDPIGMTKERAIELVEEKKKADAPVGTYKGIPFTKGKGRFGPFLKWDKLFVNVPKKYDFENLSLEDAYELIEKKIEKEANRYIHRWDDLGISVQNGRWGPFIKFKKKNVKIPKVDGKRVTSEEAKEFTLEQIKEMIQAEIPDAFKKKTRAKKKS
jgi:DNA topoisomerase-1